MTANMDMEKRTAERLLRLRTRNPFAAASVGDPREADFPDVPALNRKAFDGLRDLLGAKRADPFAPMAALALGEVGEGKTHLLTRLYRASLAPGAGFDFAYIQPIEDARYPFPYLLREMTIDLGRRPADAGTATPLARLAGGLYTEAVEDVIAALPPDESPPPRIARLMEKLERDPSRILSAGLSESAFAQLELRVRRRLSAELPQAPARLIKALFQYRKPGNRPAVMEWLKGAGGAVSNEDAADAEGGWELAQADRARTLLAALGWLMARRGRVLLVCFDRLENLETRAQTRAFGRMVEFLVDVAPAMLPLACFRGGQWETDLRHRLNQHVVTRLEANAFTLEGCDPSQAVAMVRARLAAAMGEPASDLFPFHPDEPRSWFSGGLESPRDVLIQAGARLREILYSDASPRMPPPGAAERIAEGLQQRVGRVLENPSVHGGDAGRLGRAIHLMATHHPELAARLSVDAAGRGDLDGCWRLTREPGGRRVGLIIDTLSHHRSSGAALERGIAFLKAHPQDRVVCLREGRVAVPQTWLKVAQKRERFREAGGIEVALSGEAVAELYAITLTLHALKAGEIVHVSDGEPGAGPGEASGKAMGEADLADFIRKRAREGGWWRMGALWAALFGEKQFSGVLTVPPRAELIRRDSAAGAAGELSRKNQIESTESIESIESTESIESIESIESTDA